MGIRAHYTSIPPRLADAVSHDVAAWLYATRPAYCAAEPDVQAWVQARGFGQPFDSCWAEIGKEYGRVADLLARAVPEAPDLMVRAVYGTEFSVEPSVPEGLPPKPEWDDVVGWAGDGSVRWGAVSAQDVADVARHLAALSEETLRAAFDAICQEEDAVRILTPRPEWREREWGHLNGWRVAALRTFYAEASKAGHGALVEMS